MVCEFSRGSVRHRGRTAFTQPVCLLPVSSSSIPVAALFTAFFTGFLLAVVVGIWWLFSLEDDTQTGTS